MKFKIGDKVKDKRPAFNSGMVGVVEARLPGRLYLVASHNSPDLVYWHEDNLASNEFCDKHPNYKSPCLKCGKLK